MSVDLAGLLREIRACEVCAEHLVDGPRPIVQAGAGARVVIIGQAPGRRVHESGIPWDDPSGVRLRDWLGVRSEQFYDPSQVALVPMGFCFPGSGRSGDLAPRPECAPLWHERVLDALPADRLVVVIGQYAQARYIEDRGKTLTETVSRWSQYLPRRVVMPHPSPRNRRWLSQNPWFEADAVPAIRRRVKEVLAPRVVSAGLLLHRRRSVGLEVLLGHLGGPYWKSKDAHGWTIPKGVVEEVDGSPLATAEREFAEELGLAAPPGESVDLGALRAGKKTNHIFAREGDLDIASAVSNTFEMEWPRGTGQLQEFPELDRFGWFSLDIARRKLVKGLVPFLDRLEEARR